MITGVDIIYLPSLISTITRSENISVIVTVNNGDDDFVMNLPIQNTEEYVGGLIGEKVSSKDGHISVNVKAN